MDFEKEMDELAEKVKIYTPVCFMVPEELMIGRSQEVLDEIKKRILVKYQENFTSMWDELCEMYAQKAQKESSTELTSECTQATKSSQAEASTSAMNHSPLGEHCQTTEDFSKARTDDDEKLTR